MKIIIAGHRQASEILAVNPKSIDVIFISSPDEPYVVEGSNTIENLAKECCVLLFNDITIDRKSCNPPQIEHVQQALEFAKNKEQLLICCQAGISRSSAIAYLITVQNLGLEESTKVLNPDIHIPNALIIKHGENILGFPVVDKINEWKTKYGIFFY